MKTLLRKNSPCPKCGGTMEFDPGFSGSYYEPPLEAEFVCIDCEHEPDTLEVDWQNFEKPAISQKQMKQIARLRRIIDKTRHELYLPENRQKITLDSLFCGVPEGNFNYESEPEDVGNAWNCGESDCETGWHQDCQYIDMGRENGKTWFVVYRDSIAGCGDYQPEGGWDEREGDEVNDSILEDLWFDIEGRSIDHFAGWASYDLDCAETGEDVLDNFYPREGGLTTQQAIDSARNNIKFLLNMKRNLKKVTK